MITLCDSICWLFNIRGSDVPHTPFVLAFAILHADGSADLFLDRRQAHRRNCIAHLGNGVRLRRPGDFAAALDALKGKTVLADPATAAARDLRPADQGRRQGEAGAPIPASCPRPARIRWKSKARARRISATARRCRAFWPGSRARRRTARLTEIDAAETLEGFRRATGYLSDLSFDSISGAGANGAIVHYRVTRSTNRADPQQRDVPDRFRGAISRRHHRRHPHRDRGHAHAPRCATASPAC